MIPAWPTSLPDCPVVDDYSEKPGNNVLESSMDAGPTKTRLRFTAVARPFPLTYILEASQVPTFRTFFDETIQYGALPFTIPHPTLRTPITVLLIGDEKYDLSPLGSGTSYWQLSLNLEIQP